MEENVRERDRSERESNQKTEKIRLLFSLAERGREGRWFPEREKVREREAFEFLLCLWSFFLPSERALKGKETVCAPKRGLFLSVSDLFLGKHTTKERDTFLVIFEDSLRWNVSGLDAQKRSKSEVEISNCAFTRKKEVRTRFYSSLVKAQNRPPARAPGGERGRRSSAYFEAEKRQILGWMKRRVLPILTVERSVSASWVLGTCSGTS